MLSSCFNKQDNKQINNWLFFSEMNEEPQENELNTNEKQEMRVAEKLVDEKRKAQDEMRKKTHQDQLTWLLEQSKIA